MTFSSEYDDRNFIMHPKESSRTIDPCKHFVKKNVSELRRSLKKELSAGLEVPSKVLNSINTSRRNFGISENPFQNVHLKNMLKIPGIFGIKKRRQRSTGSAELIISDNKPAKIIQKMITKTDPKQTFMRIKTAFDKKHKASNPENLQIAGKASVWSKKRSRMEKLSHKRGKTLDVQNVSRKASKDTIWKSPFPKIVLRENPLHKHVNRDLSGEKSGKITDRWMIKHRDKLSVSKKKSKQLKSFLTPFGFYVEKSNSSSVSLNNCSQMQILEMLRKKIQSSQTSALKSSKKSIPGCDPKIQSSFRKSVKSPQRSQNKVKVNNTKIILFKSRESPESSSVAKFEKRRVILTRDNSQK
ncbi:unnamed protein product [Moneuplotes crassus]|uniref:Uncharacterized protein n=1 Tax=Euplotes crassus TaxID=5936 RepID=A0AAD1UR97_EUPCR|nr:unnamed protein product [Moneuplotes crassus]